MPAGPNLTVPLKPSRRLALILALAHATAALSIAAAAPPAWLTLAFAAALVVHGIFVTRRVALLRGEDAIVAFRTGRCDAVHVQTRAGAWHEGRVLGTSFVAPFLTVVNVKLSRGRERHVLVLADSADPEAFRRLRMWLKWGWKADRQRS